MMQGEAGAIRKIVIAGGGTAGWMCASALAKVLKREKVEIALIESDAIGTVGVGEATIPFIRTFNAILGIDEDAFLRETQATFKLGIKFVDWGAVGETYMHAFGTHGADLEALKFHQFWLKMALNPKTHAEAGPLERYNLNAIAARSNRFMRPDGKPGSVLSSLQYAFHFDAGLYARFLRNYSETQGVLRLEGQITGVDLQPETGFIRAVKMDGGREITGDLFVDCTGFRGLLIGGALGVGYEEWSRYLPCNRAIAVPSGNKGELVPYTQSTADTAGWRWRIPLQNRTGNGHVFCADFMSEDEATGRLLANLEGEALADPRTLRFTTGRRNKFWQKNCVAIGLSAGFLEPLESTSIHLIQTGIAKLLALFPDRHFSQVEVDQYNALTALEYDQVRDFIIAHYKTARRDDSAFWRMCRDMEIPETLRQKLDLFRLRGRVFRREDELFTVDGWLAVLLGQGVIPAGYDPLVDSFNDQDVRDYLAHLRGVIARTAAAMPSHQTFIDGQAPARAMQATT